MKKYMMQKFSCALCIRKIDEKGMYDFQSTCFFANCRNLFSGDFLGC